MVILTQSLIIFLDCYDNPLEGLRFFIKTLSFFVSAPSRALKSLKILRTQILAFSDSTESGGDSMADENENRNSEINNGNSKLNKPKRQMKTPFQLETLEQAYQAESYPSESVRAELSEKLGLSDRQLQTWFCHRRLKDKKEGGSGSGGPAPAIKHHRRSISSALPEPRLDDVARGSGEEEPESDYGSCSGSGSSGFGHSERNCVVSRSVVEPRRRHYEPPRQSVMELRAIAIVEAQLGELLREDGPVVGVYFDEVPPDAFTEPLVAEQKWHDVKPNKGTARSLHDYPYVEDHRFRPEVYGQGAQSHFYDSVSDALTTRTSPFGNEQFLRVHGVQGQDRIQSKQDRQAVAFSSPYDDDLPQTLIDGRMYTQYSEHPTAVSENSDESSDGQISDTALRMERKRKSEEVRMAKEVEADEIRMRKEKQNVLWRKNEERMSKQMERPDLERQKEEGRSKKEQRREIERKEKYSQKENIRI